MPPSEREVPSESEAEGVGGRDGHRIHTDDRKKLSFAFCNAVNSRLLFLSLTPSVTVQAPCHLPLGGRLFMRRFAAIRYPRSTTAKISVFND